MVISTPLFLLEVPRFESGPEKQLIWQNLTVILPSVYKEMEQQYLRINHYRLGEISGSHGGEYEDECLPGCYPVSQFLLDDASSQMAVIFNTVSFHIFSN
jgi:hypothetical protein